jgi:AcrR family transcriptional regulator
MPDLVVGRDPAAGTIGDDLDNGSRERLIDAVTRLGTERGLSAVDPALIAASAGLEDEDFQRHFETADQCLLAAMESFLDRMLQHIDATLGDGVEEWPGRVRTSVAACFEFIEEVEPVARLFAVDAARTGAAGIECKCRVVEQAALRLERGRLLYPDAKSLPASLERALIAGSVTIVASKMLEGAPLSEVEPEVAELLLIPYIGAAEARVLAHGAEPVPAVA